MAYNQSLMSQNRGLGPWDDPNILDELYNGEGLSIRQIAYEHFNGDVSHEHIRRLLHKFELIDLNASPQQRHLRLLEAEANVDLTRRHQNVNR